MVRYFYAWTPLVILVGTAVLLSIPYLALIALMIVALVVLAALAWAIVSVSRTLIRTVSRRWQGRSGAMEWTAAALSPANSVRRSQSVTARATALLANPPSEKGHAS